MKKINKNNPVPKEDDKSKFPYILVAVLVIMGVACIYTGSKRAAATQDIVAAIPVSVIDQQSPNIVSVGQVVVPVDDKANTVVRDIKRKIIHNIDVNEDNTVLILGEIEDNAVAIAQDITRKAAHNKKVNVLINSPGGSVMDGVLIISAIQAAHAEVDTVCLQICASMAAMIFEYGTKRYMVDRATLMFHEAAGGLQGSFNQIGTRYNYFNRVFNKMNYEIASRAKKNPEEFRSKLANEIWLDAEDALYENFSDGIVNVIVNSSEVSDATALTNMSQTNNFLHKFRVFSK
jgi:ATP-dependent Clp protease protease subunit